MKIDRFDGGVSSKLQPQYLAPNEAEYASNVDMEKGSLSPTLADGPGVGFPYQHAAWFNEELVGFNTYTPTTEVGGHLLYVEPSTGDLMSRSESGGVSKASLAKPTYTPNKLADKYPESVSFLGIGTTLTNDSNHPYAIDTQYVIVAHGQDTNSYSKPLIVEVKADGSFTTDTISHQALANIKKPNASTSAQRRTVSFSITMPERADFVCIGRLVQNTWRSLGILTASGTFVDEFTDSLILNSANIRSFSGASIDSSGTGIAAVNSGLAIKAQVGGTLATVNMGYLNGQFMGTSDVTGVVTGDNVRLVFDGNNNGTFRYRRYVSSILVDDTVIGLNTAYNFYVASGSSNLSVSGQTIKYGFSSTFVKLSRTYPNMGENIEEYTFSNLDGTYNYVYTHYNSATGVESGPSPVSEDFVVPGGIASIRVQSIPATESTHIRLYRVGGNITTFTLVATLAAAVTTYDDNKSDSDIANNPTLSTATYDEAPKFATDLTYAGGRLYMAVEDKLYYSEVGITWGWSPLSYLKFKKNIVGCTAVALGILVMLDVETHLVTGNSPLNFTSTVIDGQRGCASVRTIQPLSGAAVWLSSDGICVGDGQRVSLVSFEKLGVYSPTVVQTSALYKDRYMLHADGVTLVYDYTRGRFYYLKHVQSVKFFVVAGDDLILGDGVAKLTVAAGPALNSFTYHSPRYAEGSVTTAKVYSEVRVFHKGGIMIEVYINDNLVASKTLTGTDNACIKLPERSKRGNYIQFIIKGTGEVYEIDYAVSTA